MVMSLVEECGVEVKHRYQSKEDPIRVAVDFKRWHICHYLCSQGADANEYCVASARRGDLTEVIRCIKEWGVRVKDWNYKQYASPLSEAIKNGHTHVSQYLNNQGMKDGFRYVEAAAIQGDLAEVMRLVEEYGIDVKDFQCWESLATLYRCMLPHKVYTFEHIHIVKYLIGQGADARPYLAFVTLKGNLPELKRLVETCGINIIDNWDTTNYLYDKAHPAKIVVRIKRWDICEYLIDQGADMKAGLIYAVKIGDLDFVKRFVKDCHVNDGWDDLRLLQDAIAGGHSEVVKYLMKHEAPNIFYILIATNIPETMHVHFLLLQELGWPVGEPGEVNGWSSLHLATYNLLYEGQNGQFEPVERSIRNIINRFVCISLLAQRKR